MKHLFSLVSVVVCLVGVTARAQSVVPVWEQRFSRLHSAEDYPRSLASDGESNIIVAGDTYTGVTGGDWVVIKLAPTGVPLWTNYLNGTGNGNDTVYGPSPVHAIRTALRRAPGTAALTVSEDRSSPSDPAGARQMRTSSVACL